MKRPKHKESKPATKSAKELMELREIYRLIQARRKEPTRPLSEFLAAFGNSQGKQRQSR